MPGPNRDDDESAKVDPDLISHLQAWEKAGSRITAGTPGERLLFRTVHKGVLIRRLPDDPMALFVSIGAPSIKPVTGDKSAYITFRGDPRAAVAVIRQALAALEEVVERM